LLHLSDQRLNTPIQQRAFTKLLGLQFIIQYKQGLGNRAADALSRRHYEEQPVSDALMAITICRPAWLETIQASYFNNADAQARLTRHSAGDTTEVDYELKDGIIRFRGHLDWARPGNSATLGTRPSFECCGRAFWLSCHIPQSEASLCLV
jgi:hypothetical protein